MGRSARNKRKRQAPPRADQQVAEATEASPQRLDGQVGAILRTDAAKEAPDLDEELEAEAAEPAPSPALDEPASTPTLAEGPSVDPAIRARKLAQIAERRQAMGESGPPLILGQQPDGPALTQEQATASWAKDDAAKQAAEEAAQKEAAEAAATAKREADAAAKKQHRAELIELGKSFKPRYELALASEHHKPPALAKLKATGDEQARAGEFELAKVTILEVMAVAEQVIDFDARLASVVKRAAGLPTEGNNRTMASNMTGWLATYLASGWEAQSSARDGLPNLEGRLLKYQESLRDQESAAAGKTAARQAARAEGRIGTNGVIIETRAITSFPAQEQTAINDALAAVTGGPRNWGGKWAEDHGNHEGNLPGAGGYLEYYVRAPSPADGAGKRRLVRKPGSQKWFYSNTHYGSSGSPPFWVIS